MSPKAWRLRQIFCISVTEPMLTPVALPLKPPLAKGKRVPVLEFFGKSLILVLLLLKELETYKQLAKYQDQDQWKSK